MAATPMNDPPSSRCSSSLFAVVTGGLAAHGLLLDGAVCINRGFPSIKREPVWPSGTALGSIAKRPWFDRLWLAFLFKKMVVYERSFATLPHTAKETRLTQLPTLMQSHFGGDSVASRC